MKKIVIICLIFIIILISYYFLLPNKVAVLGYHSFTNNISNSDMVMNNKEFEKQLKFLKKYNFKTLTLEEMDCYMNKKCKFKKNTVLITIDDGYLDNYEIAFPLLKKYNINAVVFVIGYNVDNNSEGFINKELLEKIKKEYPNIEIASHGYNLHEIDTSNYRYNDYINDIKLQEKVINSKYIAYPYGRYNNDFIKALKDSNYKLAFGFGPDFRKSTNKDNKYAIPRLSINSSMPLWKYKLKLLLPF